MEPRSPLALSELLEQPARVAELTPADLALTLSQLAALHPACAAGDRLLTVDEIAQRLSMSSHAVYRRASGFPFTVHVGRYLRFSERGLEEYLESRRGRGR